MLALEKVVVFCLLSLVASVSSYVASRAYRERSICENVFCGAGRECALDEDDKPTCVCMKECAPHYHPICASDDMTYENHCQMHREACLQGIRLHKRYNGSCIIEDISDSSEDKPLKPLVCFEIERDELRQLLVEWMKDKLEQSNWLLEGKTYKTILEDTFTHCDQDDDQMLGAGEFIDCMEKNDSVNQETKTKKQDYILRGLCVDALIVMSDTNDDWLLDFEEFSKCLDPKFVPPKKECSLEDQVYEDGAQATVSCNKCLCACGNWVCTAMSCDEAENDELVVDKGHIRDKAEREHLLRGFKASDVINVEKIDKVQSAKIKKTQPKDLFFPE